MREAADGKEKARSRDLLTLLLKSNMATDIPENQRLSDEDVIARTWLPSCLSHSGLAADTRRAHFPQRSPRTSLAVPLPYPSLSTTPHLLLANPASAGSSSRATRRRAPRRRGACSR